MGENTRRTDVKTFRHRTDYSASAARRTLNLFEQGLTGDERHWQCSMSGQTDLVDGARVLIRLAAGASRVMDGALVIGDVTDPAAPELVTLFGQRTRARFLSASISGINESNGTFNIRIDSGADQRSVSPGSKNARM